MPHGAAHDVASRPEAAIVAALGPRSVVLVGMMGAGGWRCAWAFRSSMRTWRSKKPLA
jgi:hypothetical protein